MSEKSNKPRKTHYHSTVSRRDFMKALGVGVASVGAVSFARPFIDLEDMASHPKAESVQPFWVREVDEPTIEIDWDRIERFDTRNNAFASAKRHLGEERYGQVFAEGARYEKEGAINNIPGRTTRDQALGAAAQWGWHNLDVPWLGSPTTETPEERGIPKWEGSPEEAAKTIRVAARYFGATDVGFVPLTERNKKLIYANHRFEDVEEPYESEEQNVIPTSRDLWAIVYTIPQSLIMTQRGEYGGYGDSVGYAYARRGFTAQRMHTFLHGLGYWHIGGSGTGVGPTPAWGNLAGLGEMGRTNRLVSPKYGNLLRTTAVMLTDMPLAESKPIDAGIWEFCKTCKKCAEQCPSGAISMADEPSREVTGPWNNPGLVGFYDNAIKCWEQLMTTGCTTCHAVCPYNKMDEATIHELVKISIAKAPALNGTIRMMDDTFGYGLVENPEDFWEMDPDDYPLFGLDPSRS